MASLHKSLVLAASALALVAPSLAEAKAKPGPRSHAAKAAKKPRAAARSQTATVQAQGNIQNPNPTNGEVANPGAVKPLDAPSSNSSTRKPSEGFTDTIMDGSNI